MTCDVCKHEQTDWIAIDENGVIKCALCYLDEEVEDEHDR